MNLIKPALALPLALTLLSGCSAIQSLMPGGATASARLEATKGNVAGGTVTFKAGADGLMVHARITGLKPGQEHGFHIHEKGDCSSGDGMSTGGHFNPGGHKHGAPGEERHAGDLPSLKADVNGVADVRFSVKGVSIGTVGTDVVGRGLIVHAMPDDYKTQPTGNSGARIACGVITRS